MEFRDGVIVMKLHSDRAELARSPRDAWRAQLFYMNQNAETLKWLLRYDDRMFFLRMIYEKVPFEIKAVTLEEAHIIVSDDDYAMSKFKYTPR